MHKPCERSSRALGNRCARVKIKMVDHPALEVVVRVKGRAVVLANPAMALHVVMVKGRPLAATEVANRLLMAVVVRRNVPRIATPIRRSSLTATSDLSHS